MTTQQMIPRPGLDLEYPRSLGLHDGYPQAHADRAFRPINSTAQARVLGVALVLIREDFLPLHRGSEGASLGTCSCTWIDWAPGEGSRDQIAAAGRTRREKLL